jgi:hypothetical protein
MSECSGAAPSGQRPERRGWWQARAAAKAALLSVLVSAGAATPVNAVLAAAAQGLSGAATVLAPSARGGCLPSHDGYLQARLRGASDLDIHWSDAQLQCDGGARPAARGILVSFVGRTAQGGHRVRFVFGIDAPARAGVTRERAVNVTVIFEGEQRLYSTRGDGRCTIDRLQQAPAAGGGAHLLRVQARGFCVAPATAVDGHGDLLLSRFDFAGLTRLGT